MQQARARGLGGGGGLHTRGMMAAALVLAVAALLALCSSATALPLRGHVLERSFGSTGSEAGQMLEPKGVAINEKTGDIYVVDSGNNRVDRFNKEGAFIEAWGFGVKDGLKAFETCTAETTCRKGIAGHSKGQFHEPVGIAIDNAKGSQSEGDVYVEAIKPYEEMVGNREVEFEKTVYDKFSPSGKLEFQIKGWKAPKEETEPFEEPHGVTVDSHGRVWIYNEESLFEFNSELKNKFVAEIESEAGEGRQGLSIDASGNPWVEHESEHAPPVEGAERPSVVAKLDSTGEVLLEELNPEESSGVAVDPSTQAVLVDEINEIKVFNPAGEQIDSFGTGHIGHSTALAVAGTGEPGASAVAVADGAENTIHLFEPEPPGAPKVSGLSAAGVTATSAKLGALVDPTGEETEYAFRYSTGTLPAPDEPCSGACHETTPGEAGGGFVDVPVEQEVEGLSPATKYHYQAIAFNEAGEAASAEQSFLTAQEVFGATLPDSRQWQLVSPADKHGALIPSLTKESEVEQASTDGSAFTYISTGALPGAQGNRAPEATQNVARRTGAEWATTDIDLPHEAAEGLIPAVPFAYRAFSPDLNAAVVQPFGRSSENPLEHPPLNKATSEKTPYLRSTASGPCLTPSSPEESFPEECFTPMVTPANTSVPYGGQLEFIAASPDARHGVIETEAPLAESTGKARRLFEWSAETGKLTLASVLPNGEAAVGPKLGVENRNVRNAISEDGSTVVFEASTGALHHLYARDVARKETVQLDEPQPGVTEPPVGENQEPLFQLASPDGSRIFFTDRQRLTKDATSSSALKRPDLYECVVVENEAHHLACELHDLTVALHPHENANVQGAVIGSSTDATTLYFVANGALTPEAKTGNCIPHEEVGSPEKNVRTAQCNLYMERYSPASETWSTTLVDRLSSEDEPDWMWPGNGGLGTLTSRVSPDGEWITFMSDRSLTGRNNKGDNTDGRLVEQVFSWEASSGKTRCVSCNPNGTPPHGVFDVEGETEEGTSLLVDHSASFEERWIAANIPGWTHVSEKAAYYPSRVIGDSGRMFFNSVEALVPQDTNGKMDVYEFEPAGVGGCTTASETFQEPLEGCVSLISSGKAEHESAFLDASPTGNDVFFVTTAKLAPADKDEAFDAYDASVCGISGAPACLPEPAATPKRCESIPECRTSTSTPPPEFPAGPTYKSGPSGNVSSAVKAGVLPSTEEKPKTTTKKKPLTRAQKLARALKACKKLKSKSKRRGCEKTARKRYGPVHKKSKAKKAAANGRGR